MPESEFKYLNVAPPILSKNNNSLPLCDYDHQSNFVIPLSLSFKDSSMSWQCHQNQIETNTFLMLDGVMLYRL